MKKCLVALWWITMAVLLAYGQSADEGYQPARVVSFEKLAADARHPEKCRPLQDFHALGEYALSLPGQRPGFPFH